jgi:Tol biopolymer transport system component
MRRRGGGTSISSIISAYDLEAKQEWTPDFRSKYGKECFKHDLALSPDGQQLAFVGCFKDRHSLEIVATDGGDTREIARLPKEGFPNGMGLVWTPDGRYLLFAETKGEATELWRISVEGGEPQSLGLTMKKMKHLSVHPDGHRIAFTGPGSGRSPAIWMMENFLPGFPTGK